MSSLDNNEDFDWLFPEEMMLPGERRNARRYLSVIKQEWDAWLAMMHGTPKGAQLYKRTARDERARTKLEKLSAAVLKRELGLELYMVLHIQRYGGHEKKFQALDINLMEDYGPARVWGWVVDGRALRKDGTIGSKGAGISFGLAKVYRRKLDGSWIRLGLNNAPHA
jgi:hypothetical protein